MDYQLEKNYILHLWETQPKVATIILKKQKPELYEIINNIEATTFSQKAWLWVHENAPKCYCGKDAKFLDFRRGHTQYCSKKCTANSEKTAQKRTEICKNKHGVAHFSQTDEYKQKFKNTCLNRYGVENPGQISTLKEQRSRKKQISYIANLFESVSGISKPLFSIDDYTHVRDKSLKWKCVQCEMEFESSLFGKEPRCPKCYPIGIFGAQSSVERDVISEIRKFYDGEIVENSRSIISPKELDIYFPEHKFAIEVNGVYWHSDKMLDDDYHSKKYQLCDAAGISLLMITDSEWFINRDLIVRMIKHRLGMSDRRVYARKCIVEKIDSTTAKEFMNANHLGGFSSATIHYGMFNDNELVSVVSVSGRNRFGDSSDAEIVRMAFSCGVVGALGKFIKQISVDFPNRDIVTYSDLRIGNGEVYSKNGFRYELTTKPGYWYWMSGKTYHRLSWTKKKLVKLGYDQNLTEREIMNSIGAIRFYDCGHKFYRLQSEKQ